MMHETRIRSHTYRASWVWLEVNEQSSFQGAGVDQHGLTHWLSVLREAEVSANPQVLTKLGLIWYNGVMRGFRYPGHNIPRQFAMSPSWHERKFGLLNKSNALEFTLTSPG